MINPLRELLNKKRDELAKPFARNWAKPPPPQDAQDAISHSYAQGADAMLDLLMPVVQAGADIDRMQQEFRSGVMDDFMDQQKDWGAAHANLYEALTELRERLK